MPRTNGQPISQSPSSTTEVSRPTHPQDLQEILSNPCSRFHYSPSSEEDVPSMSIRNRLEAMNSLASSKLAESKRMIDEYVSEKQTCWLRRHVQDSPIMQFSQENHMHFMFTYSYISLWFLGLFLFYVFRQLAIFFVFISC